MPEGIPIAKTLRIRESGLDEYWLQDQIYQSPGSLGLGELEALSKERTQASGGRLDLLLKNADDDSMYEVEVMLGETDKTHIIRAIEYWDNERRKWPQRQHFAVLVAESITRRFFNVIQLMSQSIPIIAIQANLIEANGFKVLNFTKVLDVYDEPADTDVDEPTTEEDWRRKSPWTLEAATALLETVKPIYGQMALSYRKYFIGLRVNQNNYFSLNKRSGNKSRLAFRIDDEDLEKATKLLDQVGLPYVKKPKGLRLMVDKQMILSDAEAFRTIAHIVREYWEG